MKYILFILFANLSFASGFEVLSNLNTEVDKNEPVYPLGLTQQNYKFLIAPYVYGSEYGLVGEVNFTGFNAKIIDDLFPQTGKLRPKYSLGFYARSNGEINGYAALDISVRSKTNTVVGSKLFFELDAQNVKPIGAAYVYAKHNLKKLLSKKSNTLLYLSIYTGQKSFDGIELKGIVSDAKGILKNKNYKVGVHFIPNIYKQNKLSYGVEYSGKGKILGLIHYGF